MFIVGANSRCNHDLTAGTKVVRVTNPDPSLGVPPPAVGKSSRRAPGSRFPSGAQLKVNATAKVGRSPSEKDETPASVVEYW